MNDTARTMWKAAGFGVFNPCVFFLLERWFETPAAAGLTAGLSISLFQWLPPRVHRDLSVAFSAATTLAGGALAALGVWAVDRFL